MKTSKDKEETAAEKNAPPVKKETDSNSIRPELAEVIARHSFGLDENRPDAVAKRQQKNQRTARANVEDLCDTGSFIEYGALAIAAQRGRRSLDDLISKTPADGLIRGIGSVNGSLVRRRQSPLHGHGLRLYRFWPAPRVILITKRWIAC